MAITARRIATTLLPCLFASTIFGTPSWSLSTASAGAPAYPVDGATVAYWRFEDPAGTAVADETGVNPGITSGNTSIAAGKFGNARLFHSGAVGDYVTVADDPTLTNLSVVTIEAWVFPATCNWYREEIVAKGAQIEPYNLYDLGAFGCPNDDGTLTFEFELINHVTQAPNTGAVAQSVIRHPINQWYYVLGSYDGNTARLYVNGVLEATGNQPGVVVTTHDPLFIHNHAFQNGQSDGRMGGIIDEVRISNVARNPSVQAVCSSPYGPDSDTVALWHLNEGAGATVVHDATGLHHDGFVQAPPGAMAGPFGPALVLGRQGSGQWIDVPSASDLDGFAEVTVEAWISPTDALSQDLVAKGPHTGTQPSQVHFEYELSANPGPQTDPPGLRFSFFVGGAGASVEADSLVTHAINSWLFIAGTYDGHVARIYVNGQLEGTSAQVDGLSISNGHDVFINNSNFPTDSGFMQGNGGIPGGYAEVRISRRARSAQEIASTWNKRSGSCAIVVNAGSTPPAQVNSLVTVSGANAGSSACTPALLWTFDAWPSGSTASLQNPDTLSPSFTPDVAGPYTLRLTASCGALSQSAQTTINALTCLGNELFPSARDAAIFVNGLKQFSVNLPGGTYTWSLPQNGSGAQLLPPPAVGQTITYQAGGTPGQDILHVTSSLCGHADIPITVYSTGLPEALGPPSVSPNPTQGAKQVHLFQTFSSQIDVAELCIDPSGSPPPGSCSPLPTSANAAIGPVDITAVSVGRHFLATRARSFGQWGPLSAPAFLNVTNSIAILLLNGYNFCTTGPHAEQWSLWRDTHGRSIRCQIQDFFFHDNIPSATCLPDFNDLSEACPASSSLGDSVCVVDNLDGRGDIETNVSSLEGYISHRGWLVNADQLILVGHSYGGQIARLYATRHPDKVLEVLTLDTPHDGTVLVDLIDEDLFASATPDEKLGLAVARAAITVMCNGSPPPTHSNDAVQYFEPGGAEDLNLKITLASLGKNAWAPLHAVASDLRIDSSQRSMGIDDVVPVGSQMGLAVNTNPLEGAVQVLNFTPVAAELFAPQFGLSLIPFRPPLHNVILENEQAWDQIFADKVQTILGGYRSGQAGTRTKASPAHPTRRVGTTGRFANTALPQTFRQQTVIRASGTLTAANPVVMQAFDLEAASELTIDVLTGGSNPAVVAMRPGDVPLSATTADQLKTFYLSTQQPAGSHQVLLVRNPQAGAWNVQLSVSAASGGAHLPASGSPWSVTVSDRSPLELKVALGDGKFLAGEIVSVVATVDLNGAPVTGAALVASVVSQSGAVVNSLTLFDDGQHGDGVAGDGIYGGSFTAGDPGSYTVSVSAAGSSPLGNFGRQTSATFSVGSAGATVSGPFVEAAPDADGDGKFDALAWSFTANLPAAGNYSCLGDLLAADGSLVTQAIATVAASAATSLPITLSFSGLDIYRKAMLGPYTLANLRLTVSTPNGERLAGRPTDTVVSSGPYWSWMSFQRDPVPVFTWTNPLVEQIVAGNSIILQWNLFDGNGATTLDLYYDTTGSGFAGTPIATGIAGTQGAMSFTWDVTGLPDGVYYVYARVRNGDFANAAYGGDIRRLLDTDGDGMPDAWETAHGLNPNDPSDAYLDPDGDGLANLDEYLSGTDPHVVDTDGGGESDLSEAVNGRDGTNPADDVTGITLRSVSPGEGDSRGGEQVLVLGTGFQQGAAVTFDGQPAANVTFMNSTRLVVTIPSHAIGTSAVTVTNPSAGSTATLSPGFTFLCDFVEPPVASNSGPFCPGQTLQLSAVGLSGATFQWMGPNGFSSTQQNPAIQSTTAAAAGQYTVTMTVGSCQLSATTVVVSSAPATPTPSNSGPTCSGQDVQLTALSIAGAAYQWTGPGGFSSMEQNPALPAAQPQASGTYSVTATVGGCSSPPAVTTVTVWPLPTGVVTGSRQSCPGGPVSIQAALSGSSPWALGWSDGVAQQGVAASPATRIVAPASSTTYSLASISDAHCQGTSSGDAVITVTGSCGSGFHPLPPCRVVDTRGPDGPYSGPPLAGGQIRAFSLAGQCGIPDTAKALSLNVTVTGPTAAGFLTLYSADEMLPSISTLNFKAGQTRANNAVVGVGSQAGLAAFCAQPGNQTLDLIVDVNGYFQ